MEKSDQHPLQKLTPCKIKKQQCIYVAAINARTLLSDSRIAELHSAMKFIKWDIIGICETRRPNEIIEEYPDFILFHTSTTNGRNGVGFLIQKYLKNNIMSFKSFSDRVATLELQTPGNVVWAFILVYMLLRKNAPKNK